VTSTVSRATAWGDRGAGDRYWGPRRSARCTTSHRRRRHAAALIGHRHLEGARPGNNQLGKLDDRRAELITQRPRGGLGQLDDHFRCASADGQRHQTNMNANEVISNRASSWPAGDGSRTGPPQRPRQHVAVLQRHFPTAMHIAAPRRSCATCSVAARAARRPAAKPRPTPTWSKIGRPPDGRRAVTRQELSGYVASSTPTCPLELSQHGLYELRRGHGVGTGLNTTRVRPAVAGIIAS